MFQNRRDFIFILLAGFFITNAIMAELIGGKLISAGPFVLSVGILPWPVVFLTTDLINEHFGRRGVRRLSLLTAGLIAYMLLILVVATGIPAFQQSPVKDHEFYIVFGQAQLIIVASIIAFVISQLIDVWIFWIFRNATNGRMIWLRATGSTIISQLFDTFIVSGIAFWLPGKVSFDVYLRMSTSSYMAKLLIAVALTPLIYVGHWVIKKFLKGESLIKD